MIKIKFSENLRQLMKDENLTQQELANKMGIAQSAISAWLNQKKEPSVSNLWLLADIFNIDMDCLVGRKDF